ncbi:hypothetical protein SAMN04487884_101170 [Butyrivibrio fibrisolvens]|uniref:ABC-2 family transporter protein n=1 Tax=Butyrivibrio fibrisolvens TaxID=831 RepID=A0A1H9KV14_BUTFI|nr:hypothetical protein [Butyrivibrio fibrisolvens]SER02633.1 hypothetical protein SAMN04487884_101170 [Butyrivibrio fibrisolvens]
MKNILRAEINRALNIKVVICILFVGCCIIFDSYNDFIMLAKSGTGYVHYFFWNSALGGMCRTYLIPIIAVIPYATSLAEDINDQMIMLAVTRSGNKKYCISKYLVGFITGGIVVAIGTAMLFLGLSLIFPVASEGYYDIDIGDSFHDWIARYDPAKYFILQTVFGFCRGAIWAGMAMLVSLYTSDIFVIIASPYCMMFAWIQMCRTIGITDKIRLDMILIGRQVIHNSADTIMIGLIGTISVLIITGILFIHKFLKEIRLGSFI